MTNIAELTEEEMKIMDDYHKVMCEEAEKQQKADDAVWNEVKSTVSPEQLLKIEEELKECPGMCFEIVDKPLGQKEDGDIWVDQYTNGGYTGDTFEGNCYMKLPDGRYFKWNYAM